jgi:broad specificity phosphatase PhoE/predicted kinase
MATNPTPHLIPEGENATPLEVVGSTATDKLVIIMVGLPATGKTHIAKRICRFLDFFHDIPSQIFNVGDYRRQLCGAQMSADFFDHGNEEALAQRTMACDAALKDMMEFMGRDGVRVAIYDATNSTKERRKHILAALDEKKLGVKKMFIESICTDEKLLDQNIKTVKLSTPDYKDMSEEDAYKDFKARRAQYEKVYETLTDDCGASIKVVDCAKFIVNNIRGYLQLKVVHFVMNLHTLPRTFYLTRHGQSEYNVLGKIGGDSSLSPAGREYARRLGKFAEDVISKTHPTHHLVKGASDEESDEIPCRLWTSTLRRTQETAQFIPHNILYPVWDNGDKGPWMQFRPMAKRNLDELYAGTCDGFTYKEIEQMFPEEFAARQKDKLAYRYPRGESYYDVTLRLEPIAHELERTREPILMIGHQGILRIIYAYFMGLERRDAPYVSIPLNTIIQLTPHAYGCHEKRTCLMDKKEMLKDGQDEPVTSMPRDEKKERMREESIDIVFNPPSC